jgi:hypothetical protein
LAFACAHAACLLLRRRRRRQVRDFGAGDFISGQEHENDRAEVVIVCEPGARSAA